VNHEPFLTEDFLLQTSTARALYHNFTENMPIFDYHCHLPVAEIAANKTFENLTDIWLRGDHYKWRAMRANGIAERCNHRGRQAMRKSSRHGRHRAPDPAQPALPLDPPELKRHFGSFGETF